MSINEGFRIELCNCEATLLREIACKEVTRRDVAQTYRLAMAQTSERVDWGKVNRAIVARWSLSALRWIKRKAWDGSAFNGRND
jgi:hypothetical protein